MGHISSAQHLTFTWLYSGFGVALGRFYGAYRQLVTEESDGLIMVGYSFLISDAQTPGLAELFNQSDRVRFRGCVQQCPQMAHQGLLAVSQVFQNSGHRVFRENGWRFGRSREGQSGEVVMPVGVDVPTSQMFDQWVEAPVLGHDVEPAGGVGQHGPSQIVGEGEIEGVLAEGGEAHELDRGRVFHQRLD
jgi:hypothetical protein